MDAPKDPLQLGIGVEDALGRMPAHVFAGDHTLITVAQLIVDRRPRLDDDAPYDHGAAP